MSLNAFFKRNKSTWWSSGWPVIDFLTGVLILFIWLPYTLSQEAVALKFGNMINLSDDPTSYWTFILILVFLGLCGFYSFFKGYKKNLEIINE